MDPQMLSEYLKRCFLAVDGLWFMMLEKTDSFDKALEVDSMVWEVLPKIQARKIKELFGMETATEENLISALKFKMDAEDFASEFWLKDAKINVTVNKCPWLTLLKEANREHLAGKIGESICTVEYGIFAREFMGDIGFEVTSRRCMGNEVCSFEFKKDVSEGNFKNER
jgi:predicted hydrocarbon binding protein